MIDDYIRNGYDLSIGVIDRGPNEGWFKASLEKGDVTIESIAETPGKALQDLKNKLSRS